VKADEIRLHVVLEEDAKPDASGFRSGDERVGPLDRDVDGLLDEDVQAAPAGLYALLSVQA
jgi:hypothetical protein